MMPILLAVNMLFVAGIGAYVVLGGGGSGGGGDGEAGKAAAEEGAEAADKNGTDDVGPMHTLKGLTVNLNDPAGDRYLRTSIVIELANAGMVKEFEAKESRIRDQIITFLSSLRFSQTQGAKGKEQIRKGITAQVNASLKGGQIIGVYFTEFVVQ